MTPDYDAIRANLTLFAEELANVPNVEDMLALLDRFARILSPDDARALVALVRIAAMDDPDDEDEEDEDEDRDPDDD